MWQQWINLILALWLVLSTYFGFSAAGLTTNVTIVAFVMAVLALWGALDHQRHNRLMHDNRRHRMA